MNAVIKREHMDEQALVDVLKGSLYPGAQNESVYMVLDYCRAAGLDPMLKPVHIVPMWDGKAGAMRDVVMPGIGLYRTQASRTGQHAGTSEPEFGPIVQESIGGVEVSYPEWCKVTVRRMLAGGIIADYTACEYWRENYAIKGGKEKSVAPNAMWMKRPRAQLAKCAEAQALRKAFPELGSAPTADEMEGKPLAPEDVPPPQIDAALVEDAKHAAQQGEAVYAKWWTEAGKEKRKALASMHEGFKAIAKSADAARTVEAQPDGAQE